MKNNKVDEFIKNPKRALFTLAVPMIIGMLVQALYNVVDTAFVGRLGADAIAALTFSFPLFFLLMAINSGVAVGMSSRISRFLGERKDKDAENAVMHGILMSIIVAGILLILGIFTMERLFQIFGASETVIPLAKSYFEIILYGVFFMFITFLTHNIFVAQGDSKTPVYIQVSALLLNIVLDYVFIYVLGYGVKGAAIATIISFFFGMCLAVFFLSTRSNLKIRFKHFKFSSNLVWEILKVGAPASLMMILMSVYVMFINRFMSHFGTNYVASFGIVSRLETFAAMPIMSFSLALMTLVGMFYGAKRYDLLKSTVVYGIKIPVILTSTVALIFFVFPTLFLRIFTPDPTLLDISTRYIRIDVFTFPLMAVGMSISRVMQGMGFGLPGLVVNLTRIIFVAVPLAYFFVFILGKGFIWIAYAMVIGGIVSNIIALIWIRAKFKQLPT